MAVKTVQAVINGQTYNLTLNSSTGKNMKLRSQHPVSPAIH